MEQLFVNKEFCFWAVSCFILFCVIAISMPVKDINIKDKDRENRKKDHPDE